MGRDDCGGTVVTLIGVVGMTQNANSRRNADVSVIISIESRSVDDDAEKSDAMDDAE